MAENRVIGDHGRIPWHLPEDFAWVKRCTLGQTIVMGRKTFEAIGRPLPKRENIIISRGSPTLPDGVIHLPSLEALHDYPAAGEVWIFGGAEIYRQALPMIGDLYLTVVHGEYPGDALFPAFEDSFTLVETIRRESAYSIRHYRRVP